MEYFGILSVAVAIAGVGLRSYLLTREKTASTPPEKQHLSTRARHVQEAAIVRRLLRYHRGLVQA